ncbi:hypothetical protein HMPREF0220_0497 [Clostridioides difficile NAP08]|uniref:Uncharacterized protein n=1 Tax=Clostridioides difficile NAP08 TaxID=525259 RepID=D5Q0R5_CLODI|nr:hypothetical protein HMPREF0220_0497 [Clostridioides difficile NAP08]EFH16609.1 hypothetical protein HMPREF0219_0740 [Clostridioides difficile NAP07]
MSYVNNSRAFLFFEKYLLVPYTFNFIMINKIRDTIEFAQI